MEDFQVQLEVSPCVGDLFQQDTESEMVSSRKECLCIVSSSAPREKLRGVDGLSSWTFENMCPYEYVCVTKQDARAAVHCALGAKG